MSIKLKLIVGLITGILLIVAASVYYDYSNFKENLKTVKDEKFLNINNSYKNNIAETIKKLEIATKLIADDVVANTFLKTNDRHSLYNRYSATFKDLKENYGIAQFHYHLPPAVSFLRVNSFEKYGDDLSEFRKTVVEVNKTKKPVTGVEVGKAGAGIRVVYPIFLNNEHIGSVELGGSFDNILKDIKKAFDVDFAVGIKEDVFKSAGKMDFGKNDIRYKNLIYYTFSDGIKEYINKIDEKTVNIGDMYFYKIPIKDYSGAEIGEILLMHDFTDETSIYKTALYKKIAFMLLIGFILVIAISYLLISSLKPLDRMTKVLKQMSEGEGDLSFRLEVTSNDEISRLSKYFNIFIESLEKDFLTTMYKVSHSLEKSNYIYNSLINVREVSENTKDLANQVATASEEMSSTIMEIAKSAQESATRANVTVETAKKGGKIVEEVANYAEMTKETIDHLKVSINKLTDDSHKIGNIISVINDIADQTNLLALNAAIEAARAGEHGRGFAVVADEVRKLAEKTQTSTKEIESMIKNIQLNVKQSYDEAEHVVGAVEKQTTLSEEAKVNFDEILGSIEELNSIILSISTAVEEQSTATEEIAQSVVSVSNMGELSQKEVQGLQKVIDEYVVELSDTVDVYYKFKFSKKGVRFIRAKIDHIKFMLRIFDCMLKGQCIFEVVDHKNCNFGKFFYSSEANEFKSDPEFGAIENVHKQVHDMGHEITNLLKQNKIHDAREKLGSMLGFTSDVISRLNKLAEKYNSGNKN